MILNKISDFYISEEAEVVDMLETCIRLMKGVCDNGGTDMLPSVAWRLADCGGMVRKMMDDAGFENVIGYDRTTGRRSILPYAENMTPKH